MKLKAADYVIDESEWELIPPTKSEPTMCVPYVPGNGNVETDRSPPEDLGPWEVDTD